MSIGEIFRLKKFLWSEQASVVAREYPKSLRFAIADLLLGLFSLFLNPYRACRKRGEVYGETPISALKQIARECQLSKSDFWLELGSGRGKSCFWIANRIGCRAMGIEKVPSLARTSRLIAELSGSRTRFIQADLFHFGIPPASCVYAYTTCFSDEEMTLLSQRLSHLPTGAQVVTISSPLPGWAHRAFPVSFPWGKAEAYLQIK